MAQTIEKRMETNPVLEALGSAATAMQRLIDDASLRHKWQSACKRAERAAIAGKHSLAMKYYAQARRIAAGGR